MDLGKHCLWPSLRLRPKPPKKTLRYHVWSIDRKAKPRQNSMCEAVYGHRHRFSYLAISLHTLNISELHKCISRYCKVSLLVVRHIVFHSLEPHSRRKRPSHKDSLSTGAPYELGELFRFLSNQVTNDLKSSCRLIL